LKLSDHVDVAATLSIHARPEDEVARVRAHGGGGYRFVAPPGYYMLFVLRDGVPSVARWVLMTDAAKDAPRIPRRRR